MSFPRTATRYRLQMIPCLTIPDATSRNTVSNAMMLFLKPPQPCQNRLTLGFPDLCHSLPQQLNKHNNWLHLWPQNQNLLSHFLQPQQRSPQCLPHLYTKCNTYATMKVRLCPHSTKTPDYRDVTEDMTAPDSKNDVLDLECPWTMLAICALRCWTLSLAQVP